MRLAAGAEPVAGSIASLSFMRAWIAWGLEKIGNREYEESIGEMKPADRLINRILMRECDLKLEQAAQQMVKDDIAAGKKAGDRVSRRIFQDILDDTEEHIEWLETQRELIARSAWRITCKRR